MKKIILLSSVALAGMFAACDDDYSDQFNIDASITDVKNQTFTLGDADYAKVASLPANKELALSKDPENKTYLEALEQVGKKKRFTDEAPAEEYLPAFLASRFPHADLGSKFVVTYNQYEAPASYLADFEKIGSYTLTSKDYETVWGKDVVAPFLSPASLSKIPSLLSASLKNAEDGSVTVVNYAYSETEPSFGAVAAKVYQKTNKFDGAGNYVIVAKAKDGKYYPFGKLKDQSKNYGYMYPAPIEIENDIVSSEVGAECVVAVEEAKNGFNLKNGWDQYLYMKGDYNNFNVSSSVPSTGGDWMISANGDGTFAMVNALTDKTVKLNFYKGSYSFGAYPASSIGVYLNASMEHSAGFKAYNISLGEGTSYVWKHDSGRKLWKGGTFVNGKNIPADSYLVSPEIDLTKADAPQLTFDGTCNFLKGAKPTDHFGVYVSADFAGDAKKATWTLVNVPNWPAKDSWDVVNSGVIDLTAFKGKKVRVGFRYVATDKKAPTWQVKNVKIAEKDLAAKGEYYDVMLYKEVSESELSPASRAAVAPTASKLFRFSKKNGWGEYKSNDARVVVAAPSVYASLGAEFIASPETVLPTYLAANYPYAEEGSRMAVVYNKKKDQPAVMEFTFKGGWLKSTTSVPTKMTFMKDKSGISANMSVYLDESLLGNEGGFKAQNVVSGGLERVWQNTTNYGWKASAFVKPNRYEVDSYLVSPALNFKKAKAPQLSFEEAANFSSDVNKFLTVVVLTNYKGDVTTATKSEPLVFERASGESWEFVKVESIDLSAYVGQTIHIAFRYTSTKDEAATWEFKNIKVAEKDAE